jgi:ornithine cyclodeaminase
VAASLIEAYGAGFPEARFTVWTRSGEGARRLAEATGAAVATDLEAAVRAADIVCTATMSTTPLIRGAWLRPGQHLDLIGAYRPDMREADDEALRRARVFCDSRETAGLVGEFAGPIARGVIRPEDVLADFYDGHALRRGSPDEITLFKNGGGAHLDLIVARHILGT